MKTYCYRTKAFIAIILLSVSTTLFAQELTKEYHREFTPRPATTLDINSKFGNVVIESWNRNLIVIDVKITVNMPNSRRAEEILSYVEVLFSESNNIIRARTEFNSSLSFNPRDNPLSIVYNIKMPVNTALTLVNSYGNTTINELSGLVNINISYGNLAINKLTRGNESPQNNISLRYGNGNIVEAGRLILNTSYVGSLNISKSTAVLLESRYSKLNFGEVGSIVGESRYDDIKIGNINILNLDSRYTNTNIGTLTNKLTLDIGYGTFNVDNIPARFESIDVETAYAPVKLGIADNASYELDSEARYGRIIYDTDRFYLKKWIQEDNSLKIEGVMRIEIAPKSKVKIEARYATVQLGR